VGEQQVVEVVEKPGRRRHVLAGAWRVRQIEELPAPLVAEGHQPWPQPVDHLVQLGQARPGLRVLHRGRPERGQVAQHQLVHRRVRVKVAAEPGLDRGVRRPPALAPYTARRHLDQWHPAADGLGQRGRVAVRPALGQVPAQLAEDHRPLLEQLPAGGDQLVRVDADQVLAERASHVPLHHDLYERPNRQAVSRGNQVNGGTHQCHPQYPSIGK
jgi:hypothetical protein